jgi:hypothetical protein
VNQFGCKFVVDTNALAQIGKARRASTLFHESAVIVEEVLREAEGFPDIGSLRKYATKTSPETLRWLAEVMMTVDTEDRTLVNLYANKGGADPIVIASALEGQARDSSYLDAPDWIVVTNDKAVRVKAEEFGLLVLDSSEFAAAIDAHDRQW